jgi:hypothetical protein
VTESLTQAAGILAVAERTGGRRQQQLERFIAELAGLQASSATRAPAEPAGRRQTVKIECEQTQALFDGRLRISVVGIVYEDSPPRHRVLGRLNAPKRESQAIERAETGFAVNYAGFDIYLMSADTTFAIFEVEENPE